MEAQAFWRVIGLYNQSTWMAQVIILVILITSMFFAYVKKQIWVPKIALGITNLFIGIGFFLCYGTEPIQRYFAFPLYIAIGLLFFWEGLKWRKSKLYKFERIHWILLVLIIAYPLVSLIIGHTYPQLVVYIMPCPVISISIVIYSCYEHKNKTLLLLMTIWGLTGIKAFLFNALEDTILLICGIYCLCILIKEIRSGKMKRISERRAV